MVRSDAGVAAHFGEHKGLIERAVDPADTRAKRLRVTGAGLAPRAIAAAERADARFFQPVPLDDAVSLLGRLARASRIPKHPHRHPQQP